MFRVRDNGYLFVLNLVLTAYKTKTKFSVDQTQNFIKNQSNGKCIKYWTLIFPLAPLSLDLAMTNVIWLLFWSTGVRFCEKNDDVMWLVIKQS